MKTYNEIRREVEREIDKEYRNNTIAVVVLVVSILALTIIPFI